MKKIARFAGTALVVFFLASFLFPVVVYADQTPIPDTFNVNNYLKTEGQRTRVPSSSTAGQPSATAQVIIDLIDLMVKFIGAVALVIFILGALLTIVSDGKDDRIDKGKGMMLYALYGIVIAFMSFIIVAFVQSILF